VITKAPEVTGLKVNETVLLASVSPGGAAVIPVVLVNASPETPGAGLGGESIGGA